jgi:predicted RNase H-like HicB family nuclease
MKILHVSIEAEDGWLIAQGLEEPGLITQARSWNELLANIQEVVELLEIGDKDLHIELIVPPSAQRAGRMQRRAKAQKPPARRKFRTALTTRR